MLSCASTAALIRIMRVATMRLSISVRSGVASFCRRSGVAGSTRPSSGICGDQTRTHTHARKKYE